MPITQCPEFQPSVLNSADTCQICRDVFSIFDVCKIRELTKGQVYVAFSHFFFINFAGTLDSKAKKMGLQLCPKYVFYALALLWFYPQNSWSFFTSIEPYEEQCYHETVKKGQVWGFLYEVSEGGFLDIDAKVG